MLTSPDQLMMMMMMMMMMMPEEASSDDYDQVQHCWARCQGVQLWSSHLGGWTAGQMESGWGLRNIWYYRLWATLVSIKEYNNNLTWQNQQLPHCPVNIWPHSFVMDIIEPSCHLIKKPFMLHFKTHINVFTTLLQFNYPILCLTKWQIGSW